MKLYVIRHGQSEDNLAGRHSGWAECSLTGRGMEDAAKAERMIMTLMGDKVDGRKEFTGVLTGYENGDVTVDDRTFPRKDVAQVRLHVTF